MITENWVTQNRVNSNCPEYSDPVPRVVAHMLTAASAEPLITTVMSGVSSLPSHIISDLRPPMNKSTHIFSAVLSYFEHLNPPDINNGVKG
jgi:hypothetical protein